MAFVLRDLLATGADDAPAISAPGKSPLSFGALRTLIGETIARLNGLGIGRNDRVAIVLPNGPEMATCFMACASGVTSAPLNPAYRADEFEFCLSDLGARALIVEKGSTSAAVDVAKSMGVRVLDLVADSDRVPAISTCSLGVETLRQATQNAPATPSPAIFPWCCTLREPRLGPRSCPCRRATWWRRPPTSAIRCNSRPGTVV